MLVCPTHCNRFLENDLGATDRVNSVALDFTNHALPVCYQEKSHGTHTLDGGVFHDTKYATWKRTTATITLGALPTREDVLFIDAP
jgi:hypothetical protein